jgi:hypothetical protein
VTPSEIIASYSDTALNGIALTRRADNRWDQQFLDDRQRLARDEIRRRILREETETKTTP